MEEGIVCVERIAGIHSHVNYDVIPAIVYTHPEIASVGKTEEQLKEAGIEYRKGCFALRREWSRANAWRYRRRVKILADARAIEYSAFTLSAEEAGD